MHDGEETATAAANSTPSQTEPDATAPRPEIVMDAAATAVAGRPRRSTGQVLAGAGTAVLASLVALALVAVAIRPAPAGAFRAHVPVAAPVVVAATTPYEQAATALRLHAAGLVDGDEQGWMSAVDPGQPELQKRYRAIFHELRVLGVTSFEYRPGIPVPAKSDPAVLTFPTDAYYCFGQDTCRGDDVPAIEEKLTMKPVGGHYVISRAVVRSDRHVLGPTPWQDGRLEFAEGSRVILAADPDEAKYLPTVLPIAEKAAAVDDKFATMLNATQTRYRIYLAGEKEWHTWYGGDEDDWAIGLAVPIGKYGLDVIIRTEAIRDTRELQVTLHHELGHVVTLTGASSWDDSETWLAEGVAEYIGWSPLSATASFRRASVRWLLHGSHPPTSMIPKRPGRSASEREGDAFYGLSHFAVDCMAHKYGQQKMFNFVKQVLIYGETYDYGAKDAYGVPFAKVDGYCRTWIRHHA